MKSNAWQFGCLLFIAIAGGCALWACGERQSGDEKVANLIRELVQARGDIKRRDAELADEQAAIKRIGDSWAVLYQKTCDRAAENLDRAWKAEAALKERGTNPIAPTRREHPTPTQAPQ